jgi:alkylation response protein AidB-like acyl-CoA dehydrogenase
MNLELTPEQESARAGFRNFVKKEIVPYADGFDQEERLPMELIAKLASHGYLGLSLSKEVGGGGHDMITFGLMNEEIARGCSSVRSLLTVHAMVAHVILRWGTDQQKQHYLPKLACGEMIAAFGLTEPDAGSDSQGLETTATPDGDCYVLNGTKKWITAGQIADLFLVFAHSEGKINAHLVERSSPGLRLTPIVGLLGVRASMLAEMKMSDCRIPMENRISQAGFSFSHVASYALDLGRYSVAWGCVGIAQACLDACLRYTGERKQFGRLLRDHQLIQQMLTDMITNIRAARLLCCKAGYLRDLQDPGAMMETSIAKYFAAKMSVKAANDAVQIHGANGCGGEYPVQRFMRDAKIMEIIEGSTQIQQITIPQYPHQDN